MGNDNCYMYRVSSTNDVPIKCRFSVQHTLYDIKTQQWEHYLTNKMAQTYVVECNIQWYARDIHQCKHTCCRRTTVIPINIRNRSPSLFRNKSKNDELCKQRKKINVSVYVFVNITLSALKIIVQLTWRQNWIMVLLSRSEWRIWYCQSQFLLFRHQSAFLI